MKKAFFLFFVWSIVLILLSPTTKAANDKIQENDYLKMLDYAVLVFRDIAEDIKASNIPWGDAQSRKLSWHDFLNKTNPSEHFQFNIGPQYFQVVNSTVRQIKKYEYLADMAEKITPPNKYEAINELWIRSARSGAARMRSSLENTKKDYEQTSSNWPLYEKLKKAALSDYNKFINEYSKIRTKISPNQYLAVASGPYLGGHLFDVSMKYFYDLGEWGGSSETRSLNILKVITNDVYSCSSQDLLTDKWTKLDIKASKIDMNGDKIDEIILPTTHEHVNLYAMNRNSYYQLLWSDGSGYAEGQTSFRIVSRGDGKEMVEAHHEGSNQYVPLILMNDTDLVQLKIEYGEEISDYKAIAEKGIVVCKIVKSKKDIDQSWHEVWLYRPLEKRIFLSKDNIPRGISDNLKDYEVKNAIVYYDSLKTPPITD